MHVLRKEQRWAKNGLQVLSKEQRRTRKRVTRAEAGGRWARNGIKRVEEAAVGDGKGGLKC